MRFHLIRSCKVSRRRFCGPCPATPCWYYDAGESIFRQGEPANRFYLIQRRVARGHERGERVLIQTLGPDDVLGWSWLFRHAVAV
jgi:CRP-like cAMP-binding protein